MVAYYVTQPTPPHEPAFFLPAKLPAADFPGAGAGRDEPGVLAARSAHLPPRNRRLRDPVPRLYDEAVHHRRWHASADGDGRRVRVARRQELPGLLRQRHHPASGRRDVLGWDPALSRAAVLGIRGPA